MELNDKVRIQLRYYGIMAAIVILLYAFYYVKFIPIWLVVMVSVVAMIVLTYFERMEFEEKLEEYDEFYEKPVEEEDDDWAYNH
jgi:archaellum biogenesis protein FlaJ (TadC family)